MTRDVPTPDISVVVPILDERGTLTELTERIIEACDRVDRTVEVLLIDDGSTDGSWQTICGLAELHSEVRGIRQRRTFGKAAALSVGFQRAAGAVIVTMDGDLQDDPAELPRFFKALDAHGVDAVSGWKRERHDPLGKRIPSKFFNLVLRRVSGLGLNDFNCGFKAYTREAVEALRPFVYGDMHRYLPAVLGAQGFRVTEIVVRHHPRVYGSSKYGVGRIFAGGFDLMTVLMLTKYRYRPMHAFGAAAAITAGLSAVLLVALVLLGQPTLAAIVALAGVLLSMTLLGVGAVSEIAVHGMAGGGNDRRISELSRPALGRQRSTEIDRPARELRDPRVAVDSALHELTSTVGATAAGRPNAPDPEVGATGAARSASTPPAVHGLHQVNGSEPVASGREQA